MIQRTLDSMHSNPPPPYDGGVQLFMICENIINNIYEHINNMIDIKIRIVSELIQDYPSCYKPQVNQWRNQIQSAESTIVCSQTMIQSPNTSETVQFPQQKWRKFPSKSSRSRAKVQKRRQIDKTEKNGEFPALTNTKAILAFAK